MKRILILGLLALAGCATRPPGPSPQAVELNRYTSTQLPLARNGQVKWSDYYEGLRDRLISAGAPYEGVHVLSQLMHSAQQFETGKISKEDFESRQKYARVEMQDISVREAQERQAQEQANRALALQLLQNRPATPQLTFTPMAPINTQPVQPMQPAPPVMPVSATAFRTGNQQMVQTVTNQSGWSCEYRYLNQTFWRTFVGTCPQSIQVQ